MSKSAIFSCIQETRPELVQNDWTEAIRAYVINEFKNLSNLFPRITPRGDWFDVLMLPPHVICREDLHELTYHVVFNAILSDLFVVDKDKVTLRSEIFTDLNVNGELEKILNAIDKKADDDKQYIHKNYIYMTLFATYVCAFTKSMLKKCGENPKVYMPLLPEQLIGYVHKIIYHHTLLTPEFIAYHQEKANLFQKKYQKILTAADFDARYKATEDVDEDQGSSNSTKKIIAPSQEEILEIIQNREGLVKMILGGDKAWDINLKNLCEPDKYRSPTINSIALAEHQFKTGRNYKPKTGNCEPVIPKFHFKHERSKKTSFTQLPEHGQISLFNSYYDYTVGILFNGANKNLERVWGFGDDAYTHNVWWKQLNDDVRNEKLKKHRAKPVLNKDEIEINHRQSLLLSTNNTVKHNEVFAKTNKDAITAVVMHSPSNPDHICNKKLASLSPEEKEKREYQILRMKCEAVKRQQQIQKETSLDVEILYIHPFKKEYEFYDRQEWKADFIKLAKLDREKTTRYQKIVNEKIENIRKSFATNKLVNKQFIDSVEELQTIADSFFNSPLKTNRNLQSTQKKINSIYTRLEPEMDKCRIKSASNPKYFLLDLACFFSFIGMTAWVVNKYQHGHFFFTDSYTHEVRHACNTFKNDATTIEKNIKNLEQTGNYRQFN